MTEITVKVQVGVSDDPKIVKLAEGATVADALRAAGSAVPEPQKGFLGFFKKEQASVRVNNTDATPDQVLQNDQIVTLVPNIVAG